MNDNVAILQASSSRLPIIRNAPSLRPNIPNTSEDGDNEIQSAAKAYTDKSELIPARTGEANALPRRATSLRCLLTLAFDLIDRVDHCIESEHGGGMTGVVITYRLQNR